MEVKVAAVQYYIKSIKSKDEFALQVEQQVKEAMRGNPQFILFPEFFTTQLAFLLPNKPEFELVRNLTSFTPFYIELFERISAAYQVHIIAGSHVVRNKEGQFVNRSYLFYPNGNYNYQEKIHLTRFEKETFKLTAGNKLHVFDTAYCKVALLICYDIEFPELSRKAVDEGAEIIFCPSWTETMHGVHRVDHCARARAVENQVFVVKTATLSDFPAMKSFCTESGFAGIYSPCDQFFSQNGIIAKGINNKEMVVSGVLNVRDLRNSRAASTAPLVQDRRSDLYAIHFAD